MSDEQKTITCYINKQDYRLFYSVSNLSGVSNNAVFAGQIFMQGLKMRHEEMKENDKSKLSAEARLRWIEFITREKVSNQEALNAIVSRGIDESQSDELQSIIEELDLNESEAVKFAEESPFAESVAYASNGTVSGQCQRWLAKLLMEKQTGLPKRVVITAGSQRGFSSSMIDRSSRRLAVVKRKEKGGHWYWYPPKQEEENNNNN